MECSDAGGSSNILNCLRIRLFQSDLPGAPEGRPKDQTAAGGGDVGAAVEVPGVRTLFPSSASMKISAD